MIVLIILFSIMFVYMLCIGWLSYGFSKVPTFPSSYAAPSEGFSIIIPFRNEAQNLPKLLKSIAVLDYPDTLYEILLIDDSSEDMSVSYIEAFIKKHDKTNIKILTNNRTSGSPKKDAIQTAIQEAAYSWIVTTDADCILPPRWLTVLNTFIQKNHPKLIAGPVTLPHKNTSFLNVFEQMDTLSLAGATIGGFGIKKPFLCNGAHLAYEKAAFIQVGGFQGNNHIASGDDHFMLEKFAKTYPDQVHYLKSKEAIICTHFQEHWASFIRQRKRWAAKSIGYTNTFTKAIGLLIVLTNLTFVMSAVLAFAKADTNPFPFLLILFIKILIDSFLITKSASFFNKKSVLKWYIICAIGYPFISSFIAINSLRGGFTWKDRYFKR